LGDPLVRRGPEKGIVKEEGGTKGEIQGKGKVLDVKGRGGKGHSTLMKGNALQGKKGEEKRKKRSDSSTMLFARPAFKKR